MQSVEDGGVMLDDYLEWVVEQTFVRDMEEADWDCLKADKLKRGWPDQLLFGPGPGGRCVVVEFKKSGAKPRRGEKLQAYHRRRFEEKGFEVYLVTGEAEANELRDRLLRKKR